MVDGRNYVFANRQPMNGAWVSGVCLLLEISDQVIQFSDSGERLIRIGTELLGSIVKVRQVHVKKVRLEFLCRRDGRVRNPLAGLNIGQRSPKVF